MSFESSERRSSFSAEQATRVFLLIILLVAYALRLHLLAYKSLWYDEAFSVWAGHARLADILLGRLDYQAPAYFTLLHVYFKLAGSSEFSLRYLSVTAAIFLLATLYQVAGRGKRGLLATGIAACGAMNISYAQEGRAYMLSMALALLSLLLILRLPTRAVTVPVGALPAKGIRPARNLYLWSICLLTLVGLLSSYFYSLALLVQAGYAGWHWRRYRPYLFPLLRRGLLILAVLAAWGVTVTLHRSDWLEEGSSPWRRSTPLLLLITDWWSAFSQGSTFAGALLLLLAILFSFSPVRRLLRLSGSDRSSDNPALALSLALVLVPLLVIVAVDRLIPVYISRYLLVGLVGLYWAWALALAQLWNVGKWAGRASATLLLLVLLSGQLHATARNYTAPDKAAWREVAHQLEMKYQPGDTVLSNSAIALGYYYHQSAKQLPSLFLLDQPLAAERLQGMIGSTRVWLVEWYTAAGNLTDQQGFYDKLLGRSGVLDQDVWVGQSIHLQLYRLLGPLVLEGKEHGTPGTFFAPLGEAPLLALQGYSLRVTRQSDGRSRALLVVLYWRFLRHSNVDYKAFTHLLGPDGHLQAQADVPIVDGANLPLSHLEPGVSVRNEHLLPLPKQLTRPLVLQIGCYNPSTLSNLATGGESWLIVPLPKEALE